MMNNLATKPPWYYVWLICLLTPIYRWSVHNKSAKLPTHQRELDERFGGSYLPVPVATRGVIWCHAVSLGELNTAYPLLRCLLNQGFTLWITSTTQTGFDRAGVLFANDDGVNHSFLPVDSPRVVGKFLNHVRPVMALFVETELWATTLFELKSRQIPSVMVNARLTRQSFLGYQRFAKISRSMMDNLSLIIAQDEQSAKHFCALGASKDKIRVADSLKWSSGQTISVMNDERWIDIKRHWSLNRPIWVAGSTHHNEEEMAIFAHTQILKHHTNALLILVPRHPERFDEVAKLCQGLTTHRRSAKQPIAPDTQLYLADSMGELLLWYGLADVVFVGGSLVDMGGHNPIEPAVLAKPIIMGQYVKNCQTLVQALLDASALTQVMDKEGLYLSVKEHFDNPVLAKSRGNQAKTLVAQKQNAMQNQQDMILSLL